MFTKKTKRYLMLLAVLGLLAIAAGGSGTFAGFNAEVANNGNYFSTGTLFLHDTAGGVTCTSESASSNNNTGTSPSNTGDGCHTIFATQLNTAATTYYAVTLKNAGTLNASDISVYSPTGGCTPGGAASQNNGTLHATLSGAQTSIQLDNVVYGMPSGTVLTIGTDTFTTSQAVTPGAGPITVNGSGTVNEAANTTVSFTPSFGAGNLCSGLDMQIVETDSSLNHTNAEGCAWGTASGLDCAVNSTVKLNSFPTTQASAHALTLATDGGVGNTGTHTGLDAGGTRYFVIAITPDAAFDNTFQNKKATVDIAWHIDQA